MIFNHIFCPNFYIFKNVVTFILLCLVTEYNTNTIASFTSTAIVRNSTAVDRNMQGYRGVWRLTDCSHATQAAAAEA